MSVKIDGIEVEFSFKAEKAINEMKRLKKDLGESFKNITSDLKESEKEQEKSFNKQVKLVRDYKNKYTAIMNQKTDKSSDDSKPTIKIGGMTAEEYIKQAQEASKKIADSTEKARTQIDEARSKLFEQHAYNPSDTKRLFAGLEDNTNDDVLSRGTVKGKKVKLMSTAADPSIKPPNLANLSGQVGLSKGKIVNTQAFTDLQKLKQKLSELAPESSKARTALRNMKMSGTVAQQLRIAKTALDSAVTSAEKAKNSTKSMNSVLQKTGSVAGKVGHNISGIGSKVSSVTSKISGFIGAKKAVNGVGDGFSSMGKKIEGVGKRIAGLAKRIFFFTIIAQAFRAIKNALGGMLGTNQQFSTSLNQIKVNLMTAFMPIYNAILPAINALASGLAYVTGVFASFISTVFGTTFSASKASAEALQKQTQAINNQGKSADKTKEKVKKLQQQLAGFDTLNTITTKVEESDSGSSSDSGNSGNSGGLDFNKAVGNYTTPKWLTDLWADIQGIAGKLWDPIQQAWEKTGGKVKEAFSRLLTTLKELVTDIGRDFLSVWTNGTGEKTMRSLLELFAQILSLVNTIASSFKDAWNDNGTGKKLIQEYFNMLNSVISTIKTIGGSFENAWKKDNKGQKIIGDFLGTATNVEKIVGGLSSQFEKGWKKDNNGQKVFDNLLSCVSKITGTIEKASESTATFSKNLDFGPIVASLAKVFGALGDVLDPVCDLFISLWEKALLPICKALIENALPVVIDALSAAFSALGLVLDVLITILDPIIDIIGTLLAEAINIVCEAVKPFITYIEGIVDVFRKIGKGDFKGALKKLKETIVKVFKQLKDSVVKIFSSLFNALWKKPYEIGKKIDKKIKEIIKKIVESTKKGFSNLLKKAKEIFENMKKKVGEKIDAIKDAFKPIGKWYDDHIKKPISEMIDKIVKWFQDLPTKIKEKLTALANGLFSFIFGEKASADDGKEATTWVEDIANAFKELPDKIAKKIGDIGKFFGDLFSGALNFTATVSKKVGGWIGETWDNFTSTVKDVTKNIAKKVGDWVGDTWDKAMGALKATKEVAKKVGNWIGDTWDKAMSKVKDVTRAVKKKVGAWVGNTWNKFTSTVKDVTRSIKKKVGGWAGQTWNNFTKSIKDVTKKLGIKLPTSKELSRKISNMLKNVKSGLSVTMNFMTDGFKSVWNKLINTLTSISILGKKPFGGLSKYKLEKGTSYHKGGLALVNDAKKSVFREAYKLPGGMWKLFPNIRDQWVNLPRGTQVLPAEQTEKMFVPRYETGTGLAFPTLLTDLRQTMSPLSPMSMQAPSDNQNKALTSAILQLIAKLDRGEKVSQQDLRIALNVDGLKLGEASVKGINRYHTTKGRMELIL